MDKVASLEQQCREQEARAQDIQSWREQLTTARKQEASQHEKLMAAFKSAILRLAFKSVIHTNTRENR